MTRNICLLIPLVVGAGCKKNGTNPIHPTCRSLDDRGIINRLDGVRTDDQALFALDGHCLEAIASTYSATVWGIRFIPETPAGETPDFHIQMYFLPPQNDQTLVVTAPETLSRPQCVNLGDGEFCGHVDDNSNDNAKDDVDLRGKSGLMEIRVTDSIDDEVHRYEGDLEWALYGVDTRVIPEVYTQPSLRMWADFKWAHPDGNW